MPVCAYEVPAPADDLSLAMSPSNFPTHLCWSSTAEWTRIAAMITVARDGQQRSLVSGFLVFSVAMARSPGSRLRAWLALRGRKADGAAAVVGDLVAQAPNTDQDLPLTLDLTWILMVTRFGRNTR